MLRANLEHAAACLEALFDPSGDSDDKADGALLIAAFFRDVYLIRDTWVKTRVPL